MDHSYDLIVLGAGSGGLAAAKRAASYGAKVAIVEGDRVGGTCVIRGCVPKKLLVYGADYWKKITISESFGVSYKDVHLNMEHLLVNVREEVDRLNLLHIDLLKKSGVDLIDGWGSFSDPKSINISRDLTGAIERRIEGNQILIAVGGRPRRPSIPGSELGWVSDDMFLQKSFPKHVLVVGAGFIACEFACILNSLGIQVTQLIRGSRLLRGFDKDLATALEVNLKSNGVRIVFGHSPIAISGSPGDLKVSTSDNDFIACEALLFATGRSPFLDGLRLDLAAVRTENNRIPVDLDQCTNVPHIFAVGDVTDRVNLTPVAIEEGRAFADSNYGKLKRRCNHDLVGKAVFTEPEIASVGFSEEKAIKVFGEENIKIYTSCFRPSSQALHKQGPRCFLKLITRSENQKVIGCHMVGECAAEIIQMASISIGMGATKIDFDKTMAIHPTIAEEFVTMR